MAAPEPWPIPPAPPFPISITQTMDPGLRRRAVTAWDAGHAMLCAIAGWMKWTKDCRDSDEPDGAAWIERGDAFAEVGLAAFRTLKTLDIQPDALELPDHHFGADANSPIHLPPKPSIYLGTIDFLDPDDSQRRWIDDACFMLEGVTGQAVRYFLRLLERSPLAVFKPSCDDESWETAPRLARLWGIDPNALSQRLRRWRVDHAACFGETAAKVKYLYLVGAVRGLLDEMASD